MNNSMNSNRTLMGSTEALKAIIGGSIRVIIDLSGPNFKTEFYQK